MNAAEPLPRELPVLAASRSRAAPPGDGRRPLLGMSCDELRAWMADLGQPAYRGTQVARWLYARGARAFSEMTDLPETLRQQLDKLAFTGRARTAGKASSTDGTVKLLQELADGRRIETVMLPYPARTSVCISSQVGCPVGCVFCATATMGFARNLTAGEMVDQVLAAREVAPARRGPAVTNVVVMGMGEPLLNLNATLAAVRLLRSELGISPRNVTISTAGYVPGIRRLAEADLPVTLALSLHAPEDALRARLIPLSAKYPLAEVMEAVRGYFHRTGRRVSLEYLLLGGVNDHPEHARQLADLLGKMVAHVNLIPWNPAASRERFEPPARAAVRQFRRELERRGVAVTERLERGQEIAAACGQLAVQEAEFRAPGSDC